jgi:hypothetical protein
MSRGRKSEMSELVVSQEIRRELAHRVGDGIDVRLLWRASDDAISVVVYELRTGACFELSVERDQALNAFHHPYAYAALRRIEGERSALAA